MFNKETFKNHISKMQQELTSTSRGKLPPQIEQSVIKELSKIYLTMADRYEQAAAEGSEFSAQPEIGRHPQEHRSYFAMMSLLNRMELDFTQKLALAVKHDVEKDIEIGKIQISFLDGVRRHLHGAQVQ